MVKNPYLQLLRIHQPIAYILISAPIIWLLSMMERSWPRLLWFSTIFILGAVIMRSAGCIINDILDRKIDAKVSRTKDRPLANNTIPLYKAVLILLTLLSAAFLLLQLLPATCFKLAIIGLVMASIYPLTKRFSYYPQAFLAPTFNFGIIMAWAALELERWSFVPLLICAAAYVWTLAYDTVYAYQDYKDDCAANIKSIATKLHDKGKDFVSYCYHLFFVFMAIAGLNSYMNLLFFALLGCGLYLVYDRLADLDLMDEQQCSSFFKFNAVIALIITTGTVLGKI